MTKCAEICKYLRKTPDPIACTVAPMSSLDRSTPPTVAEIEALSRELTEPSWKTVEELKDLHCRAALMIARLEIALLESRERKS